MCLPLEYVFLLAKSVAHVLGNVCSFWALFPSDQKCFSQLIHDEKINFFHKKLLFFSLHHNENIRLWCLIKKSKLLIKDLRKLSTLLLKF